MIGDGGAAAAFLHALPHARVYSRRGEWPPDVGGADLVVNATPVRDEVLVELEPGQTLVDLPYPRSATAEAAAVAGARVLDGLEVAGRAGCGVVRALDGRAGACARDAQGTRLARVTLELASAGESHGPALVAIVSGLPAGLVLDRRCDRRRSAPAAAGVRPLAAPADRDRRGRGARRPPARSHARDAARARRAQPRSQELDVGDEPVPARGRGGGEGHEGGDAAAARPRGSRGRAEVRALGCARRARAGVGAAHGGARRGGRGREGAARARSGSRSQARRYPSSAPIPRPSTRRARIATRSAATSRCARLGLPPGLGSYARKDDRLDARLAAALMGIQAVKGVEIGDGFALARLRGSAAHDEIVRDDVGTAPRDEPRRRASRAACRTARRSSCAPR